ncbi:unnamed protein product [Miscanthus lutarioriparius]|uniref:KIB1-4 beta-propeller domain-containing protein n=1 Tax=Miscanthus lutarioriparius TaxID=422564 RepID=A0A811QP78_9POAL|nr:unnamed protein product [Miscanthus lutarioriparius]
MNHFTKATMPLPSLSSRPYYQEPAEGTEDYMAPQVRGTWLDKKDKDEILVTSLVVCSKRLIAAIVAIRSFSTIALCRPGAAAWSVRVHEVSRLFSDMVILQGKIYALDRTAMPGYLVAIDIVDEYDKHESGNFSIIFVAGGSGFVVFEANLKRHLWAEMKTLGNDQALFLGRGCSRAVHVSPYDLSRDCIFFLDDFTGYWKKTTTACELYDMKDEKIYSPLPMVSRKSGNVPAIWIFSQGEIDKAANSRRGGM